MMASTRKQEAPLYDTLHIRSNSESDNIFQVEASTIMIKKEEHHLSFFVFTISLDSRLIDGNACIVGRFMFSRLIEIVVDRW